MAKKTHKTEAAQPKVEVREKLEGKALRERVVVETRQAMAGNLNAFIRHAATDEVGDRVRGAAEKATGLKAIIITPIAVMAETLLEQGIAKADAKEQQSRMLNVFADARAMYEELLEGENVADPKQFEKRLLELSVLEALYTGDVKKVRGFEEVGTVKRWIAEQAFKAGKSQMAKWVKIAFTEKIDQLRFVNAGTVNEVMNTLAIMKLGNIINKHPDIQEDDRVRYTWGMINFWGTLKDAWTRSTDLFKNMTVDQMKDIFGYKTPAPAAAA